MFEIVILFFQKHGVKTVMIQGERLAFSDVSFLLLQNLFKPIYVSV